MIRIGMAAPGRCHEHGWHATAVCGAFGAVFGMERARDLGPLLALCRFG